MIRRITQSAMWIVAVLGLVVVLAGCSEKAPPVYAQVSPASLSPGDAIPIPDEPVILTITGNIGVKNSGDTLVLDIFNIERMGLVEYTISDGWRNEDVIYTGVLMSDVLKYAGVPDSATSIRAVALDDYSGEISIAEIEKWPVLLATRSNRSYMGVGSTGPTRIIFPFTDEYPEIDFPTYRKKSIWSLATIEVQ